MKKIYFTVEPSQVYPTVPTHLRQALMEDIPSLSHLGKGFENLYKNVDHNLRKLLRIPQTHSIFFVGSAFEGIERTLQSCVGKHSFHFVNGPSSKATSGMSEELGNVVTEEKADDGEGFLIEDVTVPRGAELIFITENETSTGTTFPRDDIQDLHTTYPDKLIALNVSSSVPADRIDFKVVDIAIFSGELGFGLPAGLGVLVVGEQALKKAKELNRKYVSIGSYHSFLSLATALEAWQTPEPPNIMNIYLLGKVTEEMNYKGIRAIRNETEEKAKMLYRFFEIHPKYRPFVADELIRSQTTIVIDVDSDGELLRKRLADKGIIVGSGYGEMENEQIILGNFPAHSVLDIKKLIDAFKKLA